MADAQKRQTWEEIAALLQADRPVALERYLESLTPAETARAVARLNETQRLRLFAFLSPGEAAAVILDLPDAQAAGVIAELSPADAAPIVASLPDNERADVLGDVPDTAATAILAEMPPAAAGAARQLMAYSDDSAGGLMTREFLAFAEDFTVGQVIDDLRRHRDRYAAYDVQYAYVLAADGRLAGVLRMRDLLLAQADRHLSELMMRDPIVVRADDTLAQLRGVFQAQQFLGLPVVDRRGHLIGVVTRDSVLEEQGKDDQRTFLKMSGIFGGEELRSMHLFHRVSKRLSWLSLNILLNVLAASVIAVYQKTISAAVILAVFLPIISDMSGCSGNQAVAVSIRELSIGLVRASEFGRVLLKEVLVGVVNGLVLGGLLALVAVLWQGNAYLGLVVGVALALNTLLSVCLGGLLPLVLRHFKMDPALASGPILTTVTDMCGFFFVLSFATLVLKHLAG